MAPWRIAKFQCGGIQNLARHREPTNRTITPTQKKRILRSFSGNKNRNIADFRGNISSRPTVNRSTELESDKKSERWMGLELSSVIFYAVDHPVIEDGINQEKIASTKQGSCYR